MFRMLLAALTGGLFSVGLSLSGMTKPQKVIDFLDVSGNWDPSLAFVMVGAIVVFAPLFWWVKRRDRVAFGERPSLSLSHDVDRRLLIGSALFGLGWGLGGYCPGPALTVLGSGSTDVLAFALAMVGGMAVAPRFGAFLDQQTLCESERALGRR